MGNEMGNNNTSGLREEDSTKPEAEGKTEQEVVHFDDLEAENDHKKEAELASSDDPTQKLNWTEQKVIEINPPLESPEAEQKLNEENGKDSENQPPDSLPEKLEDLEDLKSSNLEEELNKNQMENLSSLEKEEEESNLNTTSDEISSTDDAASEDSAELKSDQHQSEQDSTKLPAAVEENSRQSDLSESNLAGNHKENGHASDNHISSLENGDGYSLEKTTSVSDPMEANIEDKNDGETATDLNCDGTNSLDMMKNLLQSDVDVSILEDKCIILTEESERADAKHGDHESDLEINRPNAPETDSLTRPNSPLMSSHDAVSNGNCQVEEVKVADGFDRQNESSEEMIMMTPEAAENGENSYKESADDKSESYTLDAATNGNCLVKDSDEGEHDLSALKPSISNGQHIENEAGDCKLEAFEAELPVINGKESEDYKSKEEEHAKIKILVIKEKIEVPCHSELIPQQLSEPAELHTIASILPIPDNLIREEVRNSPSSAIKSTNFAEEEVPDNKTQVKETVAEAKLSEGRLSNESIPDYLNAGAEMRKSPSFGIDLHRSEESDQSPLLSLETSLLQLQYNEELPSEEKVITLERSDSEKSRTPFLKEEEEEEAHHVVPAPKKQDAKKATKEVTPTPSKSKEKYKRRSSLFTNCMCCTTVIH